jgi:hypothetical protein
MIPPPVAVKLTLYSRAMLSTISLSVTVSGPSVRIPPPPRNGMPGKGPWFPATPPVMCSRLKLTAPELDSTWKTRSLTSKFGVPGPKRLSC